MLSRFGCSIEQRFTSLLSVEVEPQQAPATASKKSEVPGRRTSLRVSCKDVSPMGFWASSPNQAKQRLGRCPARVSQVSLTRIEFRVQGAG